MREKRERQHVGIYTYHMILVAVQVTRNLLKMALRTVSTVHSNSPAMNHMSTIRKTDPIALCLLGIEVSFPVIGVYEKLSLRRGSENPSLSLSFL